MIYVSDFPEHEMNEGGRKEGIIQFTYKIKEWKESPDPAILNDINRCRSILKRHGLIGEKDGVGYGNISVRWRDGFLITGSQTSSLEALSWGHLVYVAEWDILQNRVLCYGSVAPSSETLTHAACYEAHDKVRAVVHVHSAELWRLALEKFPTTSERATNGSVLLAIEVKKLLMDKNSPYLIFGMRGHEEGVVCVACSLEKAVESLLECLFTGCSL